MEMAIPVVATRILRPWSGQAWGPSIPPRGVAKRLVRRSEWAMPAGVSVIDRAHIGSREDRGQRWCDPMTGTTWRVDNDVLAAEVARSCDLLLSDGDASASEPCLNLPWLGAGPEPWRLRDQSRAFAALYFAVSRSARQAWEQEGRVARVVALTAPTGPTTAALRDPAAAQACLDALAGAGGAGLGRYGFDIVRGGAVRIQQYVLETDRLPGIRGASALLARLEGEVAGCFPVPDCVLSAGGGHLLAVVPAGEGAAAAARAEKLYRDRTVTARAVAASVRGDLREVRGPAFRQLMRRLEFALAVRQHSLLPTTIAGALGEGGAPPGGGECTECLVRDARYTWRTEDQEHRLCESCERKRRASSDEHGAWRERYAAYSGTPLAPTRSLTDIAATPDAGGGAYLGLLYGDGNGLGAVLAAQNSLPALRCFSTRLDEAMQDSFFEALRRCNPFRRAEIVVLGGDDARLFVPGPVAWSIANAAVRHFEETFRNATSGEPTLTMSIGVLICHPKTPLVLQNDAVVQLLRAAKHRAKAVHGCPESAVDIAVLDSFDAFADSLAAYREATLRRRLPSGATVELTTRPFALRESVGMWDAVRALAQRASATDPGAPPAPTDGPGRSHRTQIHALADALRACAVPEEADIFLHYQMARAGPAWRAALDLTLRRLRTAFGDPAQPTPPSLFVRREDGEGPRSAWLDLAELLDFAGAAAEGGEA